MELQNWFFRGTSLTWPDYTFLLLLVAAMVVIGMFSGREESDTSDFFLGDRRVPWWAACLSFVATEISAVTIIAVPAVAYSENWEYAQFFIGSFAARVAIAYLFIPAFYQYNCTSIYEFLRHRFGPATQYAGSVAFFVTRLFASGVRLMAASLAVSMLIGWHILPTIVLFAAIGVVYIGWGGIKAVVWTNVLQALSFIVAGIVAIVFIVAHIHGGAAEMIRIARSAGRLQVFDWGPNPADMGLGAFVKKMLEGPNIVFIAILNGFFGSMASFGTDQELMQRLLTVETRRESQKTMILTTLGSLLVLLIYLALGTGLFAYYAQNGAPTLPKVDEIFPHFVQESMPVVMRGLMLAAIVMASIDSPLSSLSSSFVMDIYRPLIRKDAEERHYLIVSRWSVAVFGLILCLIAYYFARFEKILWLAFKIGSVTGGSLLGVFLLGLLTKRKVNRANIFAMFFSAAAMLVLLILSEKGVLALGWSWLLIFGTLLTFAIGWVFGEKPDEAPAAA